MFKEQLIILGEHKIPSKTVDKFFEKLNFLAY